MGGTTPARQKYVFSHLTPSAGGSDPLVPSTACQMAEKYFWRGLKNCPKGSSPPFILFPYLRASWSQHTYLQGGVLPIIGLLLPHDVVSTKE